MNHALKNQNEGDWIVGRHHCIATRGLCIIPAKAAPVFLPSFHCLSGRFSLVLLLRASGVGVYLGGNGCHRGRHPLHYALERFLTQPFFATEQFSGSPGKLVSLKDALDGCERILSDEFKDYPESASALISGIELTTNGQKVAWSLADYLASLAKGVEALRQAQEKAEANPAPEPKSTPKPTPRSE